MQENRHILCAAEMCKRKQICMRHKLVGNFDVDTWIDFKPVQDGGKFLCEYFIHAYSDHAGEYIKAFYTDLKIKGGQY